MTADPVLAAIDQELAELERTIETAQARLTKLHAARAALGADVPLVRAAPKLNGTHARVTSREPWRRDDRELVPSRPPAKKPGDQLTPEEWVAASVLRVRRIAWIRDQESFTTRDFAASIGASDSAAHQVIAAFVHRGLVCRHPGAHGTDPHRFHARERACPSPKVERAPEREPEPEEKGEAPPRQLSPEVRALVEENTRLVTWVVKRMFGRSQEPAEDLAQEGMLGLFHAAERFDPLRGRKFSTYATLCIRGYILRYLNTRASTVRTPKYLQTRITCASLDRAYSDGSKITEPSISYDRDESLLDDEQRERVGRALARLDERSRLVLELRFGLREPSRPLRQREKAADRFSATLDEIGLALGLALRRDPLAQRLPVERPNQPVRDERLDLLAHVRVQGGDALLDHHRSEPPRAAELHEILDRPEEPGEVALLAHLLRRELSRLVEDDHQRVPVVVIERLQELHREALALVLAHELQVERDEAVLRVHHELGDERARLRIDRRVLVLSSEDDAG